MQDILFYKISLDFPLGNEKLFYVDYAVKWRCSIKNISISGSCWMIFSIKK